MSVKRETTLARRRLVDARAAIDRLLAKAPGPDWDILEEVMRRGAHVIADGYPTQSMADSDIHGGFAQTGSTSTERAALRWGSESAEDAAAAGRPVQPDDPDREERDLVGDVLREVVCNIAEVAGTLDNIDRSRKLILSIQGRRHGRESTVVNCPLCTGLVTNVAEDRIKAGLCPACYTAWRRAGSPRDPVARSQFERARLEQLKLERRTPDPHVACAHACCPPDRRAVAHDHWKMPDECRGCAEVRAQEAS